MASGSVTDEDLGEQVFRDSFAEFERGVLQDNILLCDQKSGILLAFAAAMVLVCLDGCRDPIVHPILLRLLDRGAFAVGAIAFLFSCYFALQTVVPRIRRGGDDHIYWESSVFKLPVERYVARFREMDSQVEGENRLRYLHSLASICRIKFRHFTRAMYLGELGFLILIVASIGRTFT